MSLLLKESVCELCSCKQLQFSELTGIYNAISNPGGYGSPNPVWDDAISAVLTITLGDGVTSYNIDLYATGYFPTNDRTFEYTLVNEDFGYTTGDKIPDQILTLKYTIGFGDSTIYSTTIYKGLICNTKCCVQSMLKDIDWTCDCSTVAINNYLQAKALYDGLLSSIDCGDRNSFTNQLNQLNKICLNSSCSKCN